ncbi:type VII secretion protein EccB [uncultured Jatrophihabitans sp.]|uniref:type VII secretion protein EccB n=1 Tax=uncultured Jatrophihabitans sp. TaxID=1610747 RepID=UPI0035C95D30
MPTTRDLVEAYGFASRRQVLALLNGDDSVAIDARRRLNRSLLGGLLVCVAIVAAVGVAGFLSGGSSTSLPNQGVIVDSSTGGNYVLVDNVLHPALNLASARLIAGSQSTTVSSGTLRKLPRGLPVGIPGAPDQLPPTSSLVSGPWTVCSTAPQASAARPRITVSVGAAIPTPVATGGSVVLSGPNGQLWLLAGGLRFAVTQPAATLLQLDRAAPVPVLDQILSLVPQGPPLTLPSVPDAGRQPSVRLPFTASVGDVVRATLAGRTRAYYVVLDRGVAPIGSFAAALLGGTSAGQHTVTVSAADLARTPSVRASFLPTSWPNALRPVAPPRSGQPLCLTYARSLPLTGGAWPVSVSEPRSAPLPAHGRAVAASSGGLPTVATGVAVPPGRGSLVKATGSGGVDGSYEFIADSGLRYPISSSTSVTRLGYMTSAAAVTPLPFVQLLPSGPALDPSRAAVEYPGGAGSSVAPTGSATSTPTAVSTPR